MRNHRWLRARLRGQRFLDRQRRLCLLYWKLLWPGHRGGGAQRSELWRVCSSTVLRGDILLLSRQQR